jgi:hypothetical protein
LRKENMKRRMGNNAVHASHTTCTNVLRKPREKKKKPNEEEEVVYPCSSDPCS